jgi:hypothetical protein
MKDCLEKKAHEAADELNEFRKKSPEDKLYAVGGWGFDATVSVAASAVVPGAGAVFGGVVRTGEKAAGKALVKKAGKEALEEVAEHTDEAAARRLLHQAEERAKKEAEKRAAKEAEAEAAQRLQRNVAEVPEAKPPHRNRADDRPATLYKKYDSGGEFEKHGVTHHENPEKRYTKREIAHGRVDSVDRGPRKEMLAKERDRVETDPGPLNREPWAGKRKIENEHK